MIVNQSRETVGELNSLTVSVVRLQFETDADWRHSGRPLPVGETAIDLLAVERAQLVALLAVVTG